MPSLIHRHELFVFHDRADSVYVAAETGELAPNEEALATAGLLVGTVVDGIVSKAWDDLAGDNALQRVRTADTTEIHILEILGSVVVKCVDRRNVPRIGQANAFE